MITISCNDVVDYEDSQKEEYARNFIKEFGVPDEGHTFNMVGSAKAYVENIDPRVTKVRLLTAFPGNDESRLLAEKDINTSEFTFDTPLDLTQVYFQFLDADGNMVNSGYRTLSNGGVYISENASRAATIGTASERENITSSIGGTGYIYDTNSPSLNLEEGTVINKLISSAYLLNQESEFSQSSTNILTLGDMLKLVGPDVIFEESAYKDNKCILERYKDEFHVLNGVELTTNAEDEVIINYIYGNTVKQNVFGYFYYPVGSDYSTILNAPKYVLINNATPGNYNSFDGSSLSSIMSSIKYYPPAVNNYDTSKYITTTEFQLTYYDSEGVPHEKFPANYCIAFFIGIDGAQSTTWANSVRFSLLWMNNLLPNGTAHEQCNCGGGCSFTGNRPNVNFITYQWGDKLLVGVEDEGTDDDMNDLIFYVKGSFNTTNITKISDDGSNILPSGTMLAVEDLGSSDDWDFNDLVVGVMSQDNADGSKTVRVDPLAAGGTLPIRLMYTEGSKNYFIGPEFHSWFGVSTSTMVNTGARATQPSTFVTFTAPSTFSMSSDTESGTNMGGFWVLVDKDQNYSSYSEYEKMEAPEDLVGTVINPPTSLTKDPSLNIPYMLCLTEDWHWPQERKHINVAYGGGFGSWVTTKTFNWYATGHTNTIDKSLLTLKPLDSDQSSIK